MSDLRCPRCGAARRPGDQWCGLCFVDLREPAPTVVGDATPPVAAPAASAPPPDALNPPLIRPPEAPGVALPPAQPAAPDPAHAVPAIPTQPAPSAAPVTGSPFVPSTNPLASAAVVPTQTPEGVVAPAGEEAPEDPAAAAKWPCPRCGEEVPLAEDHCPACGGGFLENVRSSKAVTVPVFGDVSKMNTGQKVMFGVAIAFGITLGVLLLFTVGGAIFH